MATVVGVRFRRTGKNYYFDPSGLTYKEGDGVIVETARGIEYADVTFLPREIPDEDVIPPLKPVIRIATEEDRQHLVENAAKEKDAMVIGLECIENHGLDMKLVDVEYTFDDKKIIFYFTADGRVDFRELVRNLAARFHVRIELRQIGVRDETKMMGGLGICGREVCCATFLRDFVPVSIRMAKDQGIALNPTKISGLCGRLMCCLQYEEDFYVQAKAESPRVGADMITPDGPGELVEHFILRDKYRIRVVLPDLTFDTREYACSDVSIVTPEERKEAVEKLEKQFGKTVDEVRADAESRADRAREMQAQHQAKARPSRPRPVNENKAQSVDDVSILPTAPVASTRGNAGSETEAEEGRDEKRGLRHSAGGSRHYGTWGGDKSPHRRSFGPKPGRSDGPKDND